MLLTSNLGDEQTNLFNLRNLQEPVCPPISSPWGDLGAMLISIRVMGFGRSVPSPLQTTVEFR